MLHLPTLASALALLARLCILATVFAHLDSVGNKSSKHALLFTKDLLEIGHRDKARLDGSPWESRIGRPGTSSPDTAAAAISAGASAVLAYCLLGWGAEAS